MKTVRFAKHYSKLDDSTFTTIRKHEKDILDKTVRIITPNEEFTAECTKIDKTKLGFVNSDLFKKDTDTDNIYNGISELRKYYPGINLHNMVYVYYFEKVD